MTAKERRRTIYISFAIMIAKFIEMGALTSVMPVISIVIQPELLEKQGIIHDVYVWSGLTDAASFIIASAIASCSLLLLGGITELVMLKVVLSFVARCGTRLADDLMRWCVDAPYAWHAQQHSVSLTRLFQSEISVWSLSFLLSILQIFNYALTIIIGVVLVIKLASLNALIALVILGIGITGITFLIRPKTVTWANRKNNYYKDLVLKASNLLTGNKDFKFSLDQNYMIQNFTENYALYVNASANTTMWGNVSPKTITVASQLALLIVAIILWSTGASQAVIVSQMAILLLITSRLIPAANQIVATINILWGALPWIETIHAAQDSICEAISKTPHSSDTMDAPPEWKELKIDKVSFAYEKDRGEVFSNISLNLEFGKHYGFVGPSGSGKSSLIDLISCLQRPTSGAIFVDGVDLVEVSEISWRKQIGYVSQDPFYADDSIRNNIAYGCAPELIDDDLIWESLALAQVDEVVKILPEGLDTRLGERSVQISGGQRQRLAIARALYKKPRLLILDEATSALDSDSEKKVMRTIYSLRGIVTVLSISHRNSAIEGCDDIHFLGGDKTPPVGGT